RRIAQHRAGPAALSPAPRKRHSRRHDDLPGPRAPRPGARSARAAAARRALLRRGRLQRAGDLLEPSPARAPQGPPRGRAGLRTDAMTWPPRDDAPLDPQMQSFLAACGDNPDDPDVRLIFADWLDERDDPRAELIRLQAEYLRLKDDYRGRHAIGEKVQAWVH